MTVNDSSTVHADSNLNSVCVCVCAVCGDCMHCKAGAGSDAAFTLLLSITSLSCHGSLSLCALTVCFHTVVVLTLSTLQVAIWPSRTEVFRR